MSSEFDRIINRYNTDCLKYDFAEKRGKPKDILPLWVADMDFCTPDCVIEALENRSRHGIFGYSDVGHEYKEVLHNWFMRYFQWHVEPAWLVKTPGVVFAICAAIRALTNQGDAILIQQPVYYPFSESILSNNRKLIVNQLIYSQGKYTINWQDFEEKIIKDNVKLFVLCSPHNPVGRVWTEAELKRMGDICLKHGVMVISDEVHADFVYPGNKHIVFANIKPEFQDMSIICTAPTKTFNLAGLQVSNIFIPNPELRQLVEREIAKCGYSQLGIMGLTAAKIAYENGHQWLADLKIYLADNLTFVRHFILEKLPKIKLIEPEGTYLLWLDFREFGISDHEIDRLLVYEANLWFDAGTMFGLGGEGFQRINIACPRGILAHALVNIENVFK